MSKSMAEHVVMKTRKADKRTGDWVVCQRYGRQYRRRRPIVFRDAKTPTQLLQRGRMDAVVAFYATVKRCVICDIWRVAAQKMACSGYNLFVGANINAFNAEGMIFDYSGITLSAGRLPLPGHVNVVANAEGDAVVRWNEVEWQATGRRSDRLMVGVIYDYSPFEVFLCHTEGMVREDMRAVVRLNRRVGDTAHLYVFFGSESGKVFSEQRYFKLGGVIS